MHRFHFNCDSNLRHPCSSVKSPQSLSPSHFHRTGIHLPLPHWNCCRGGQVRAEMEANHFLQSLWYLCITYQLKSSSSPLWQEGLTFISVVYQLRKLYPHIAGRVNSYYHHWCLPAPRASSSNIRKGYHSLSSLMLTSTEGFILIFTGRVIIYLHWWCLPAQKILSTNYRKELSVTFITGDYKCH